MITAAQLALPAMRQTGSQDYVFADHFAWETAKEAFRRLNQERWKDDLAFRLQKA